MIDIITGDAIAVLVQVVMIDLVLAGDNAVVIGLAAAGLPPEQRRWAIIVGVLTATVLRILFAGITTQLLQVLGACARRRDSSPLGLLEEVARAAHHIAGRTESA